MSPCSWKRVERIGLQDFPYHLDPEDDYCVYAREYVSGGGFASSDGNDLISNYKKPMSRQGRPEWKYKNGAINQFADELSLIIPANAAVTYIPPSESQDDPDYDPRHRKTLERLARSRNIVIVEPFSMKQTMQKSHLGGSRSIQEIYNNLQWHGGIPEGIDEIYIIDDVLTTGAHFKACKQIINENYGYIQIYGVFWAKVVWK